MLGGSDGKFYHLEKITDYEMLNFNNLPFNSIRDYQIIIHYKYIIIHNTLTYTKVFPDIDLSLPSR